MASCLLHDSSCVRPKHSGCVPMRAYAECQDPTCAKVLAPERPFRLEHSKIMSNNVLWGSGAPKKNPANSPSCNHSRVLLKYLSVPSCTLPQPSVPSCRVLRRFNHRQSPPVSVLKWPITVLATLLYKSVGFIASTSVTLASIVRGHRRTRCVRLGKAARRDSE